MKKNFALRSLIPAYVAILSIIFLISWGSSRAILAFSANVAAPLGKVVIIDAGHGGVDGGATSVSGVLESKINLEIAQKLNDLLHLLGIHTKMIRTEDVSIYTEGESIAAKKVSDLKNRIKIVNETEDAILISIHQNHFSQSKYKGAQVFYGPLGNSKQLAEKMQSSFRENINPSNMRQIKKADGVFLLQNIQKTGILIECGFISNPEEESLLRSQVYQNKVASVIATTLSQYFSEDASLDLIS